MSDPIVHFVVSRLTLAACIATCVALLAAPLGAATITVNSTADTTALADGQCTLREAIANANQNADTTGGDCAAGEPRPAIDTIAFNIPGAVPHTIAVGANLPSSTDLLHVDGLTQPANGGPAADCQNGPLLVALDGGLTASVGLEFDTSGSDDGSIRGLAIGGFTEHGIELDTSDDNLVQCNFVGTDATGTVANANKYGIRIFSSADRNVVGTDGDGVNDANEGNLISGNTFDFGYGIHVSGAATDANRIAGNKIGTDVTGTALLSNKVGIRIRSGPDGTIVGTNGDGSPGDAAEGNVISGAVLPFEGYGVSASDVTNTWIAGNRIGTDVSGTASIPSSAGVRLFDGCVNTLIGTNRDGLSDALERNVISGNTNEFGYGIRATGSLTSGTRIMGNWIGVDVTGNVGLPNKTGISIADGPQDTVIGTDGDGVADAIEGNVISGNLVPTSNHLGEAIKIEGTFTVGMRISGNLIGTDPTGSFAVPNNQGIRLESGLKNALVGTDADGVSDVLERNVISGNRNGLGEGYGVWAANSSSENHTVAGNFLGTDATGTVAIPNDIGIWFHAGSSGIVVGTDEDGVRDDVEKNIISGNTNGVRLIRTNGNRIVGNDFGLGATGDPLPNTRAVWIEFDSNNTLRGNRILHSTDVAIELFDNGTLSGSTDNCVVGNAFGVRNNAADVKIFESNWWGFSNGPGGVGGGAGDTISANVDFDPFLVTAPAGCPTLDPPALPPTVLKSFLKDPVQVGRTTTVELVIQNPNPSDTMTDVTLSDDLDAMLPGAVAEGLPAADVCGAGSTLTGTSTVTLSGGVIAPSSSCVVTFAVRIPANAAVGTSTNTTSTVSGVVASSAVVGDPATAEVTVRIPATDLAVNTHDDGATPDDGVCTLREAILNANANTDLSDGDCGPGEPLPTVDLIRFDLPGQNQHFLEPTSDLPAITETVTLDGLTQPSNGGFPTDCLAPYILVHVSGRQNPAGTGLRVSGAAASGTVIRGLAVLRYNAAGGIGLHVEATSGVRVECNVFGNDGFALASRTGVTNATSLLVDGAATGTLVGTNGDGVTDREERNIFSGTSASGVLVHVRGAGTDGTVLAGNWIGTNSLGSFPNDTTANGLAVLVDGGATNTRIGTDADGVADGREGNTIGGAVVGLAIRGTATDGTVVAGNRIGLQASREAPLRRFGAETGVEISGGTTGVLVGSDLDGVRDDVEGNVISGHEGGPGLGVLVTGASTESARVQGNLLGTSSSGADSIPNKVAVELDDATGVRLKGNRLRHSTTAGIRLTNGSGFDAAAQGDNCLVGNTAGLLADAPATFEGNWWGHPTGPSGAGGGLGDSVAAGVDVTPFLTAAPAGCTTLDVGVPPEAIFVTSTGDDTTAGDGVCTLREAIGNANQNTDTTSGDCAPGQALPAIDTIAFVLPGTGPHVIGVASSLPRITETIIVDGLTQPTNGGTPASCTAGPLLVAIQNVGSAAHGLELDGAGASGSTIRGLAVGGFAFAGLEVDGASSNVLECNFAGTDATGTVAVSNDYGIRIRNGATGNLVLSNLLSGNTVEGGGHGVQIAIAGTANNTVAGNKIGTDITGLVALANNVGVRVRSGATGTVVGPDNLISGNAPVNDLGYGVHVSDPGTDGTWINGNWIGVDATGSAALGNFVGVRVRAGAGTTLVGTNGDGVDDNLEGNILSGHVLDRARGVYITDAPTGPVTVAGNLIGTDTTGLAAIPNEYGVWLSVGANGHTIGDDGDGVGDAAEGNVISGNTAGFGQAVVLSDASSNRIAGNLIGPATDGGLLESTTGTFGNDVGIRIRNGSSSNLIVGNTIAGNRRDSGISEGIQISGLGTDGNRLTDNLIGDPDGLDGVDQGNGDGLRIDDGAIARVDANRIFRNVGDGIDLRTNATLTTGSTDNCLEGNFTGVDNVSGVVLDVPDNWWGAADGPSGAGSGSGDPVTLDVIFSPFLTTPPQGCGE